MKIWQKILLAVLMAVLLVLTILACGSIGSGACVYCLIMMGAALLVEHFMINRDEELFDEE